MTSPVTLEGALRLLAAAGLVGTLVLSAAQAAESTAPAAAPLPSQPDEVVSYVTKALTAHDIDAFERIVEWKGARPVRKRMTLSQIRYSFGRPIKSATVEPFSADGFKRAKDMLDLDPNMAVTEQLKVVFDEPVGVEGGTQPTSVFLLGKEDGRYRIGLLLAHGPPK